MQCISSNPAENGLEFEASEKLIFIIEQKIHQGRNVKRFREMLHIKQEAVAYNLGNDRSLITDLS
ncbi:hypothetical protein [Flavobacterium sp. AJR]|uniref:hypothetical protein n=1 Tax=Flavobacterium sp. AJR TaxID=1979369 RepID=UPI000B628739|nr:hypothetical protein [Flavobacterium sp. AJR]OUL61990.1 hypothetical protein B8T70_12490 [Flavobacterium sp. AJR]